MDRKDIVILGKELAMWRRELEELNHSSEIGGGGSGSGRSGKISDITGTRAVKIAMLCEKINDTLNLMTQAIIEEDDPVMRMVLNYRWVHTGRKRLTWNQISKEIYGSPEYADSLRKAYERKYKRD